MASKIMTVREMIDAAIQFVDGDPIVDFKMLESILYIIAGKLRVLRRHVLVTTKHDEYIEVQAKKLTKMNPRLQMHQIKVHGTNATKNEDTTTAESSNEHASFSGHVKRRSRSKSTDRGKVYGTAAKETEDSTTVLISSGMSSFGQKKNRYSSKSVDKSGREGNLKPKGKLSPKDTIHDKILLVYHMHMSDDSQRDNRRQTDPSSSIATLEQYERLLSLVRQLQIKFGVESSGASLHKQTSLIEPMAAINMATRMVAVNNKLKKMLGIITQCASISGIDLDLEEHDVKLLYKSVKETPVSGKTSQTASSSKASTATTESKENIYVGADIVHEDHQEEMDTGNLATWSDFNLNMDDIRTNFLNRISKEAVAATNTAKRASKLFREAGPKLTKASIIGAQSARFQNLVGHFIEYVNYLDTRMIMQLGDCQESMSNMQNDMYSIAERIHECLAHPPEDPAAVAALSENFNAYMIHDLPLAKERQTALSQDQIKSSAHLKRIQKKIEIISRVKTTRNYAAEVLKTKTTMADFNGLVLYEHLNAVVASYHEKISQANEFITSEETRWQIIIDDYISHLVAKCDPVELLTLNNSVRNYCKSFSTEVDTMLDFFGDYPININKKKLIYAGNCLSCFMPADAKVSDKYMKLVKKMMNQQLEVEVITQDDEEVTQKPCVPGQPIPHPLDSRSLICERYCGRPTSNSKENLSPSLFGIDVVDINLTRTTDMESKVHLTCSPCNSALEF